MGNEFTAKDLRTYDAIIHAIELLNTLALPQPLSRTARRRARARILKTVAGLLRTTPAVCRQPYVDAEVSPPTKKARRPATLSSRKAPSVGVSAPQVTTALSPMLGGALTTRQIRA
jgi:DNA topoisomerase I